MKSLKILASKEGLASEKYKCCDPGLTVSLVCLPPPKNADEQWMAWNDKLWYPMCIYDESTGQNVSKQVGVRVTLTVSFKAESGVEVDDVSLTAPPADKDGIFWFSCINPFLFGVITLTFSGDSKKKKSEYDIVPLVISIKVDKDKKGKGYADSELVKREVDTLTTEESTTAAATSSSAPSRKRALSEVGGAAPEKKVLAVPRKLLMPFVSASDNILPMPSVPPLLSAKYRIERMVGTVGAAAAAASTDGSSSTSATAATICGPVLQTELSTWLANAIRDDKAQVETYRFMEQWGIDIRPLDQARSNMQRPTSNELFLRLQKAAVQIPESEKSVQLLRNCFECMFENNILYTEEKAIFKSKLENIRHSTCKYADNFGPYYFLRFLVFFVTAADSSTFDDVGSSSAVRRNAASNRQGKSAFVKIQELIDLAVKDLNENAHHYFA